MRKSLSLFKKTLYYLVMVLVCFEISLWIIGYRPYSNHDYKVEANPENAFVGHATLGISCNPGDYQIVLNDNVTFRTTHLNSGQRLVSNFKSDSVQGKVAFLGCSFTYGYGVNNDETFVSRLQQEFPDWEMMNFGTPGFGTVQSYLQLQELIKDDSINVAVLVFSNFHFMRNVMSHDYRSNLKIGFRNSSEDVDARMSNSSFPFISNRFLQVEFENWSELYSNYPLRNYFASVNWLQNNVDKFKDRELKSIEITEAIIQKMKVMCNDNGIAFKMVCLDNTEEVRSLQSRLDRQSIVDVHFDFKNKSITHLPYDSHPNARGHELIANRIGLPLSRMLNGCE